METVLIVIAILVFLIVAHEFGHFLAAKIFGVKVEEFGIGYPPRAFSFGRWGETEYTLNWLPFGGFVRLFGENGIREGSGNAPRSLIGANRGVQAIILIAGVVMNAIAAWGLFTAALWIGTPRPVDSNESASGNVELIITEVVQESPADAAGLLPGDQIISIVSTRTGQRPSLAPDAVADFVASHGGQPLDVVYERAGETNEIEVRPANGILQGEASRAALGIKMSLITNEPLPLASAMKDAFSYTMGTFSRVLGGLWHLVSGALHGQSHLKEVVGPIGLAEVVSDASRHGLGNILSLAGFVSVNLAIINLLPLPALDGGRLVFIAIEAIRRRRVPHAIVSLVNGAGFALIIVLMIVVTYHDLARLIS